jgi:hypothetical protein
MTILRPTLPHPMGLLLIAAACASALPPPAAHPIRQDAAERPAARAAQVIRRFPAPEAKQAVAVDTRFFYAIDDAEIAKYDKSTGRRVGGWRPTGGAGITHLNSGIVVGRRLYCAHSNYPDVPMVSSIEVFDTARMAHVRTVPLPGAIGSATWVDQADGSWWVTFAHYARQGGEPGKGPEATTLVRFDRNWHRRQAWSFPAEVVARWDGMSSSGGAWSGRRLYTTGHHAPELYVLELPATGRELVLREIIQVESEGQGIALDRVNGLLYSIQRRTHEVLVSSVPGLSRGDARSERVQR